MFAGSLLGQRGVVSWSSDQEENSDSEWQVDPALQPLWGKKKKKKNHSSRSSEVPDLF